MKLQTQIPLQSEPYNQIDYHSKIVLLGSCFAENIGEKFNYYKFQHLQNPFGILFHPLAIEQLITNAINEKEYQEHDIFFHNEQWHCFDAHSKLSDASKASFLNTLNNQILLTSSFIKSCSHVIITLGTAWVYRHIESDSLVANCHKVPQKQFEKELLTVDQITESLEAIRVMLKSVNPKVSIIYTVSPVRHLKDGFVANSQSKAHLISAIHNVVEPRNQSYYFPSYEIMLDELRDYRFYKDDMIHPNNLAIKYIWKKFQNVWISNETDATLKDIELIQRGLDHKPFNPNSESYQLFLKDLKAKQQKVKEAYSHIIF